MNKDDITRSVGPVKDSWTSGQYVEYYNRIIKNLEFPVLNQAGDPSCYAEVDRTSGTIRIVLWINGALIHLPIGGVCSYRAQILAAYRLMNDHQNRPLVVSFLADFVTPPSMDLATLKSWASKTLIKAGNLLKKIMV